MKKRTGTTCTRDRVSRVSDENTHMVPRVARLSGLYCGSGRVSSVVERDRYDRDTTTVCTPLGNHSIHNR